MIEWYKTPLTDEQQQLLAILRVPLFYDKKTDEHFISKGYWNGITQPLREALARLLAHE
jgi:hypothetical protein